MSGGSDVIGLWRNREAVDESMLSTEEPLVSSVSESYDYEDEDIERPTRPWRRTLATILCAGTALSWVGLLGYQRFFVPGAVAPSLENAIGFVTTASAPLALIGVGWLLMMRSSRSEAKRFAETAEGLQAEQGRLESALGRINDEINASRERLSEQAMQLLSLGDGASSRINLMTRAMENEIETLGRQAETPLQARVRILRFCSRVCPKHRFKRGRWSWHFRMPPRLRTNAPVRLTRSFRF
jgi:hypothetical protein